MRINKDRFNKVVNKIIEKNKSEFYNYKTNDLYFQYVDVKKVRNSESYDIIVSISELEVSLTFIRDIIEETSEELGISINRILIEI